MKKNLLTLLLCALFAFAAAGCKNESNAENVETDGDAAFEQTQKEVDESLDHVKNKIEQNQE